MSIKFRNKIIIVFKRGKRLSKQKEKLDLVVNSKFYIHECLKENGMMFLVNNLVISVQVCFRMIRCKILCIE